MPNAVSFLWNATRGHRLRPWRSEYVKWRIETYSGMKAETMTTGEVFRFAWAEKRALLRFLMWAGKLRGDGES
jgi:hypothetical protein